MEEIQVLVVGGSIAGLCCAVSLLHHHRLAGQTQSSVALHVVVLEKARSLTAAGAGLGLDPSACAALLQWKLPLLSHTLPLSYEENRVVHGIPKREHVVARDQEYDYRAAHWSDVHRMLYDALPVETVKWGHEVIYVEEAVDGKHVNVHVRNGSSSTINVMQGNLVIAADGSMSETRKRFLPHETRRYRGYCAWRGVLDTSTKEGMELQALLQLRFPHLGRCLYFDIAENTHTVLYELPKKRLNWLWYVNQPEPKLKVIRTLLEVFSSIKETYTRSLQRFPCGKRAHFLVSLPTGTQHLELLHRAPLHSWLTVGGGGGFVHWSQPLLARCALPPLQKLMMLL